MRNHVSKFLVGVGVGYEAIDGLSDGEICGFDYEAQAAISSSTKVIGFAKGTANAGYPILAGPIEVAGITEAYKNDYEAAQLQKYTLQVTAVPAAGKTAVIKVVYHDNLSIIPNQIKQSVVAVTAETGETNSSFAGKIAAEFAKQDYLFVTVSVSTATVTFEAKTLKTASSYNGIDRPEAIKFEVGFPQEGDELGAYTLTQTAAFKMGQGDPSKIAWLADQFQGRQGFSDRRMWNNTKKYASGVDNSKNYDTLVINAEAVVEGDMQGVRSNPVGVMLALTDDTATGVGSFYEDLAKAVTLVDIPAS